MLRLCATDLLVIQKGRFLLLLSIHIVLAKSHSNRYAYIEFASKDSVDAAVALTDSTLKDRQIKVGEGTL